MPRRTLNELRERENIPEQLRGEALKDFLVNEEIPFDVTGVQVEETEFGEQWRVTIASDQLPENANNALYFALHPSRDAIFTGMGDATETDPYGPLKLERRGAKKWQELVDA